MKRENLKQNKASQLNTKEQNQQEEQRKVFPQVGTNPDVTSSDGTMSEGNLSNSRYSRQRTRSLKQKQFIMGSDTDGQAV